MAHRLNIITLPIGELETYAGNPRTHAPAQVRQIAKSIRAFGFINPVLIDKDNQLIAGHGRLLAAQQLGLNIIPCIRIEHLTEDEKRAYLLADNKLAENASWDPDLLRVELSFLSSIDVDVDVELTGFSMPEIDQLLTIGEAEETEESPPPPPNLNEVISRLGDCWQLGPHRLICGDCRDPATLLRLIASQRARMVFTDPPYNVPIDGHARGLGRDHHPDFVMASGELSSDEYIQFLKRSLGQFEAFSVDGALHYICMDWRHLLELLTAGKAIYQKLINLCVWNKTNGGMGSFYRSQHELIFVFKHGTAAHINNVELGRHGRYRTNIWNYPGVNSFGSERDEALALHPTVKPVRLIADAILDASKRGDIVLDGFAGSGSTLLAAEQTGRSFHGIEIDARYVDVILKRWIKATGEMPVHADSGLTSEDVVEQRTAVSTKMED